MFYIIYIAPVCTLILELASGVIFHILVSCLSRSVFMISFFSTEDVFRWKIFGAVLDLVRQADMGFKLRF